MEEEAAAAAAAAAEKEKEVAERSTSSPQAEHSKASDIKVYGELMSLLPVQPRLPLNLDPSKALRLLHISCTRRRWYLRERTRRMTYATTTHGT